MNEWARAAVTLAARGQVSDENLRALLGSAFDPERAWEQSRTAFQDVIAALEFATHPIVGKLVVPLAPSRGLTLRAPGPADIQAQFDREDAPPSLVVHPPLARRDWDETEEYRRPLTYDSFVSHDGQVLAQGMLMVLRTRWEIDDDSPYRRSLLFEAVRP